MPNIPTVTTCRRFYVDIRNACLMMRLLELMPGIAESLLEDIMMRKMLLGLPILLSSVLCVCSFAQNTNGTILGTVADSTNAMIENATITATNTGTQARTSATSSSDGSFSLQVPPGSYDVMVEASGFQTFKTSGIQVLVNEDSRVAAVLHPGAAVQVVNVSGINTHIDTTSATLKNVVGEQTIQSMPLNGRNPISLVLLVPGVTRDPNASVTSGATYPSIGGISINGTRSDSTNYILDGASDNDNYTNAPNPYPDPDALQEFSVQTNNFSAEFGRLAGGVVNVVTKSGTNQIHGSAFEYIRNNYFNAANHFSAVTNGLKSDDGLKGISLAERSEVLSLCQEFTMARIAAFSLSPIKERSCTSGPTPKVRLFPMLNFAAAIFQS